MANRLQVTVDYPVDGAAPELLTRAGMSHVVGRADELGYDAIAFTDHPAPSAQWLGSRAGHETLDVVTALSFCAAVTERIRLMTYLLVVPYRNPFLAAKALATVDRLSDGRLVVVAGTGYLREEFDALGIEFERRNELLDEGLDVMRAAWTGEPVTRSGIGFRACDTVQRPAPAQGAAIPILVGGNSARARARAARHAGWSPLVVDDDVAAVVGTKGLTVTALPAAVRKVRAAAERPGPFVVQAHTSHRYVLRRRLDPAAHREHLAELRTAGVDSFVLKLPNSSVQAAVRGLEEYAATYW